MSKDRKLSSNGITDGVIWEQLLLFFGLLLFGFFGVQAVDAFHLRNHRPFCRVCHQASG